MRVFTISDTHGFHTGYEIAFPLPDGYDCIVHAGDISKRGTTSELNSFLHWFSSLDQFKYKIFIAGNHDFLFEANSTLANSLIPDNIIYLNDSGIEIDGIKFWGSPVSPWFYNWAFNRYRGDDIKKHWDLIPNDTDVLITHGPPLDILDFANNSGKNVGCKDLLDAINRVKPKYHIFGHIHEGYGEKTIDGVNFINASVLNERYYITNEGIGFEISK